MLPPTMLFSTHTHDAFVDWQLPGMLLSLQNSGLRSLQMLLAPVHNLHTSRRFGLHPALLHDQALRDLAGVMATTALCSKAVSRTLPAELTSKTEVFKRQTACIVCANPVRDGLLCVPLHCLNCESKLGSRVNSDCWREGSGTKSSAGSGGEHCPCDLTLYAYPQACDMEPDVHVDKPQKRRVRV